VTRGKVLGCLVFSQGIKTNPDKIKAIIQMQPLQTKKEGQKLMGRIAALNRFIVNLAERSLPFFSVLRGSTKVEWGPEQQRAFDDLKQYLQHLPKLSSPEQGQPLILLYISTMHLVVSGALVVEKEAAQTGSMTKQQYPVYFVSEVLAECKKYYSEVERFATQSL
jgi:hypothetical protein